jgi:hypothetical protein
MKSPKNSPFTILDAKNLIDVSQELLLPNGKMKLFPAAFYDTIDKGNLRLFCYSYARYGIPTTELIDFLIQKIDGRSAIEIGSGHGDLGYHLNIKMSDSKIQKNPEVQESYRAMKQPIIDYPDDVEEIDALDAVEKYKPSVVVASWVTTYAPHVMPYGSNPHGIKETKILDKIETFIIVGNNDLHGDKPIRKLPHLEIYEPWIKSRATNPENNRIYIWDR